MTGVMRTLRGQRRPDGPRRSTRGYTQATDLAEYIVQTCGVDYRSAYDVVGRTVREASRPGIPGRDITGAMLDEAAVAETGQPLGSDRDGPDRRRSIRRRSSRRRNAAGGAAPVGGPLDGHANASRAAEHSLVAVARRRSSSSRPRNDCSAQARRTAETREDR